MKKSSIASLINVSATLKALQCMQMNLKSLSNYQRSIKIKVRFGGKENLSRKFDTFNF